MPTLRIHVSDEAWPAVMAALTAAVGPPPASVNQRVWAEQVTAGWFRTEVAAVLQPSPEPSRPSRRIRPSRVRA